MAFKFHILPPVDKGSSGVVSVPEDITPGKYNIALYILKDKLRGFWPYTPSQDEIFDTMKTFMDLYGYKLEQENIVFPPSAHNDRQGIHSHQTSTNGGNGNKAKQWFSKKSNHSDDFPAQPADTGRGSYRGRGRGYGRGNNDQ